MLFWYGWNLPVYHSTGHHWDVPQVRAKGKWWSQRCWLQHFLSSFLQGHNVAWCQSWPCTRQPGPLGVLQCMCSPLVRGKGKKSVLSLFGVSWNLITQLLLFFVLTTTFLHPTGKYLSREFHLTCANIKGKSPVTASEQFTLILRSSHLWSLTSFVFLDLFEKYVLAYPKY